MNKYTNITIENISNEHLCCAISDKKHCEGVSNKKQWLKERISEGHVFRKLNAQGKIFIEYSPLENAWVPIVGNNYMYIYCLWVAGSYKGNGYAKELLEYAISDAKMKNKNGICVLSSKSKKPFLSDKSFFKHYDFKVVDEINDYELLALSFGNEIPSFTEKSKTLNNDTTGISIYYSPQCPYINNCIKEISEYSKEKRLDITFVKIDSLEKAKDLPCVFNNWAVFKNGKFVTTQLLNKNLLEKMIL